MRILVGHVAQLQARCPQDFTAPRRSRRALKTKVNGRLEKDEDPGTRTRCGEVAVIKRVRITR